MGVRTIPTFIVSDHDRHVGLHVHALIRYTGLPQAYFYERMGMSRGSLAKKMRGEIRWTLDDLYAVAGLLDVPIADLLCPADDTCKLPRLDSNQEPSDYWFAVSPPQAWRSHVTCIQPTRWG